MKHHDRLFGLARTLRHGEEKPRPADLLDEQRDHARGLVGNQLSRKILHADHRLVAGGDHVREADAPRARRLADRGHHGAALRHQSHPQGAVMRRREQPHAERHAVDLVDQAETIRPEQREPGPASARRERILLRAPGLAGFGEARREHDRAAHAAASAGGDRFSHRRARNAKDGDVDTRWQIVDRRHAGAAEHLGAAAAHQMDGAPVVEAPQAGQDIGAERARLGRDADDRDRAWPQQPRDRHGLMRRIMSERAFRAAGRLVICHGGRARVPADRSCRRETATCPAAGRAPDRSRSPRRISPRGSRRPSPSPCA